MPKRFTATEKWADPWFCGLGHSEKLLWIYALDNCDHASLWEPNFPLMKFMIGDTDFEAIKSRLVPVPGKTGKYLIPKFLIFQYGEGWPQKSKSRSGKVAAQKLKTLGLFDLAVRSLGKFRTVQNSSK